MPFLHHPGCSSFLRPISSVAPLLPPVPERGASPRQPWLLSASHPHMLCTPSFRERLQAQVSSSLPGLPLDIVVPPHRSHSLGKPSRKLLPEPACALGPPLVTTPLPLPLGYPAPEASAHFGPQPQSSWSPDGLLVAPGHPAIPPVLLSGFGAIASLALVRQVPDSPGPSNPAEFSLSTEDRSGSHAQGAGRAAGGEVLTIFKPTRAPPPTASPGEPASPARPMGLTYEVASQLGRSLLEMWHYPLAHAAP